jgi:hypothetical protein
MASEQSCGRKLFIRHLPSVLSNADKTDLLKHFGAKDVVCMGRNSKMVSKLPLALMPSFQIAKL